MELGDYSSVLRESSRGDRFIVVKDNVTSDGSFLIHHYISAYLKNGGQIILFQSLGHTQTHSIMPIGYRVLIYGVDGNKGHYASVSRKLVR
jgi:hypothetical protein